MSASINLCAAFDIAGQCSGFGGKCAELLSGTKQGGLCSPTLIMADGRGSEKPGKSLPTCLSSSVQRKTKQDKNANPICLLLLYQKCI